MHEPTVAQRCKTQKPKHKRKSQNTKAKTHAKAKTQTQKPKHKRKSQNTNAKAKTQKSKHKRKSGQNTKAKPETETQNTARHK